MISLIVAFCKESRVIGIHNQIPWHIKEEFKHFKNYTMGKTLLMGDNTFQSIGKPLPGRKTIVATIQNFSYEHEDVSISHDLFSTLKEYKTKEEELVVCGGASIYKLALPYVDKMVISWIKKEYEGDAFFPLFEKDFNEVSREEYEEFIVVTYVRKSQHD